MSGTAAGAGRRVVVTGGRGFLGTAVVRELAGTTAQVHAVGRSDYDLTVQTEVARLYADLSPDVVVHAAAAVGGIGANVGKPGRFLSENALMGLMLLEGARQAGTSKFVLVSTTCTYPEDAPLPLSEEDLWSGPPTGATGPYGIAKRTLHEACRTYAEQYDLDSSVLVLANLYGPGDRAGEQGHVIPSLVARYLDAQRQGAPAVTNWGTGRATREFLHVRDAARAVAAATTRRTGPEPINIGTGRETSIREVAELVGELVGYTGEVRWDETRPDGQPRRYLDVARAARLLDWRAEVELRDGLGETVAWQRDGAQPS